MASLNIYIRSLCPVAHPWNALFHLSFLIPGQSVGLFWRGISPSQGRYLHKHKIISDIHAVSGIRTHDDTIRGCEDSSCLRTFGHYDRRIRCHHWKLIFGKGWDCNTDWSISTTLTKTHFLGKIRYCNADWSIITLFITAWRYLM
jgi:hypothetical protein